jgi:hypothetical protein
MTCEGVAVTQAGEDCYAAIVRLGVLWDRGLGESEHADALRNWADVLWERMTPEDRLQVEAQLVQHRLDILSSGGR